MPRLSSSFADAAGIAGCARIAIWRTTSAVTYSTVAWRFAREIAVGFRHHSPDRIERLVDLLGRHRTPRQREHAVGLRQDRSVVVAEIAGLGQHARKLPCDHRQR